LSSTGSLVSTFETSGGFAPVHGEGFFGNVAGQQGPALISQLANGQLDILGFNNTGTLIHTDLVSGTVGLPTVVGGGMKTADLPAFSNISGGADTAAILTQLPNGELDAIGLSGDFGSATLALSQTLLMPTTIGDAPVKEVNPNVSSGTQTVAGDVPDASGTFGVQLISQLSGGTGDALYLDSGYTTPSSEGNQYATQLLTPLGSNWNFVDGGFIAKELFPVT
jgi:hypothetical protein